MRQRLRSHLTYANVMATIAVFLVLSGGTAVALNGSNTVFSDDIVDGEVKTPDVASGAVSLGKMASDSVDGSKVVDNSLTGADIDEAKLDPTPLRTRVARGGCDAAVGGTGAMVKVGDTCIDRYEASVWSKPNGGVQYGVSSDDYPCSDNGQDCSNIYARSVPGVTPSRFITYFQAQQALANSGKRLPTNAEWQAAVAGTPDSTACNVSTGSIADTGANPGCVSRFGANDMVGNLSEWVADWVAAPTNCNGWGSFSDDRMCLSGASTTAQAPSALTRGGGFGFATDAGPFAVQGFQPQVSTSQVIGFRGAR
jgi:hypothetical protein